MCTSTAASEPPEKDTQKSAAGKILSLEASEGSRAVLSPDLSIHCVVMRGQPGQQWPAELGSHGGS